jgi:hypothetical protein
VECGPKFSSEPYILVRDEVEHQAIFTIPFVKKGDSDLGSSVCGVDTGNVYVLENGTRNIINFSFYFHSIFSSVHKVFEHFECISSI